MIDHVSIGVRDIARTKRFYNAALKPLGYTCLSESEGSLGYGQDAITLWISGTDRPVPADLKSGFALLLRCADAAQCRGIPRSGLEQRGARQWHARPARRLQP